MRSRFWNFILAYPGLSLSVICAIFGLVSLFALVALLGMDRSFLALVISSLLTIALLIILTVKVCSYDQRDHGAAGSDFGSGYEKPKKNLAKHQPDALSEQQIDKAIAKINKRKPRP